MIIDEHTDSNDDRAELVETYILQKAIEAGVVKEVTITQPKNPNKWGKSLAPWYNDECRKAR